MKTMFPVETVPDGTTLAAHHAKWGLVLLVIMASYAWDSFTDREPLVLVLGAATVYASFTWMWPYYPLVGAVGSYIGLVVALIGLLRFRKYAERPAYHVAWFSWVVVLDDILEHSLGIWTPFDWAFGYLGAVGSGILAGVTITVYLAVLRYT